MSPLWEPTGPELVSVGFLALAAQDKGYIFTAGSMKSCIIYVKVGGRNNYLKSYGKKNKKIKSYGIDYTQRLVSQFYLGNNF